MMRVFMVLVAMVVLTGAMVGCRAEVEGTDMSNVTSPR